MPIVNVVRVGKSFGAERIFGGVSFQIDAQDRIGLVGPNGAGKTTLLNLLAGYEEPDEGTISVGRDTRIGYLVQNPDFHPENTLREEMLTVFAEVRNWEDELHELAVELEASAKQPDGPYGTHEQLLERYDELQTRFEHAGGYTYEYRIGQVLDGLGFTREQQQAPVSQLSGGQQTRAALGKLLLQEPDLLLLDEPTNHLDLAALEWLETYLSGWKGAMVVVAHDRYFLDKIVSRIIEMAFGRIEEYPGNYTKYLRLREERKERQRREYEAQQAHIAHTEEFIRRYKAGQRSREARGRQKLLNRLERVERPRDLPELRFEFTQVVDSGLVVLSTQKLVVGYPPSTQQGANGDLQHTEANALVRVADLELLRGDCVGLIGPNGAGKTTLLRTIIGELPPLSGQVLLGHNVRIGYYSQTHEGLNSERTIIDEIRRVSALSEEGVRTFLGRFLFTGDDVFKTIGALSGGERSRVALAKLTLQGSNFLVLDEPTNHLDLQSRQFLEEILGEFEGTLLFVSHDRYFIDRLATKVWVIEDGVLIPYFGNYTEYRTRKRPIVLDAPAAVSEKKPVAAAKTPPSSAKSSAKKSGKVKVRTVEDVERDIEQSEAQVKAVEEALAQAALNGDAAQLTRLSADYEQVRARLEELLAEWEQLAV